MHIPEFNLRLCSPTSTTKHTEIASRFSGAKGMILQLNNVGHGTSWLLRSWDCSWISNYGKDEDERLFIGGRWTINLQSVTLIKTKNSYGNFFKPLFQFDCMISGTLMDKNQYQKLTPNEVQMLINLINHKVNINIKEHQNEYHKYINDTFASFTDHKTQITINPVIMLHHFKELYDLIMHPIKTLTAYPLLPSNTNLMKPTLFQLFRNVLNVVINSTQLNPHSNQPSVSSYDKYPMNLLSLLLIIEKVNLSPKTIITIKATHEYQIITEQEVENWRYIYKGESWISKIQPP
eukprot:44972_1